MLVHELKSIIRGQVSTDEELLKKASRDASIFEIKPEVVVAPRNAEDVKRLVKFVSGKRANGAKISLTARSGGTDMSGGALTTSIVVDFARHMHRFRGIAEKSGKSALGIPTLGEATAEPGMFYRDFEKETLKKHLLMPSYPASREICTIGGMVANNSGGEKTLSYGKTEDYIAELKAIFSDGEEHLIRPLDREELTRKLAEDGFEGELYRRVHKLIQENQEAIMVAKPDVSKNSAGYYLWNVWDRETGVFDLTRLITGSQGTLGLVTEITFKLVRPKPHSLMAVIFLKETASVAQITNELLKFNPESLECYDDKTLKLAIRFFPSILIKVKTNIFKFIWSFLPDLGMLFREKGLPKLVIMAELTGENENEIYARLGGMRQALAKYNVPVHLTRHEAEEAKYWTIRRESFNLLRQHVKGKHTLPVIDDVIVKPEYLPEFLPKLQKILDSYGDKLTATLAGHNGNGNFHVIPLMNFKDPEARKIIPELMDRVYDLVFEYKGSITAEHNDGLIRTPYLKKMYGEKITGLFREVKNIFDPLGIFNPGKKVPVEGETVPELLKHIQKD
jgi:FAD/FMN-containing dehydrogenase